MNLYHGSIYKIESPKLSVGKVNNDFGQGFYCTENFDLAAEWACQRNLPGFVNSYELDLDKLSVLDLLDGNYSVLHWIALLLQNRIFDKGSVLAENIFDYLLDNYALDLSGYDVIIGYRADDSYFSYASSWLNNSMSVQSLTKALRLGDLGEQVVLKSQKAFENLHFISAANVDNNIFYKKFVSRDSAARNNYKKIVKKDSSSTDGIFAIDLLREGFDSHDTRLRSFILKRR